MLFSFLTRTTITQAAEKTTKPRVLFIYPVEKGFPFWDSQVNFAQAVSDTLNFELDVAYPPEEFRDRFGASIYIQNILDSQAQKPDLIITSFWVGSETKILTLLDDREIPLISINSDISPTQFSELGLPREQFPLWLAHLSPDDTLAGGQLATAILQHSRANRCPSSHCNVNIFAITGASYSAVSKQRINGMNSVLQTDKNNKLLNIVYGNWERKLVKKMTSTIFKRHEDIHAFWIASDVMAYGLQDGIEEFNLMLPKSTVIGSMDWSPSSIDKIKDGSLNMSLGGHFLEGGLALILFFDYLNDRDFKQQTGTVIKTKMSLLDVSNVGEMGAFLKHPKWSETRINGYSKFLNPQRENYNFNPQEIIMEQLTPHANNH